MLIIKKDITKVVKGIIGHGCNCSGGFGTGVAGSIKKKWPIVSEKYHELVGNKNYTLLGKCQIIEIINKELYVVNCFTQINYGYNGRKFADINAIQKCLIELCKYSNELNLPIYIPKIGCGLGGLDWDKNVKMIVETISNNYLTKKNILVCEL